MFAITTESEFERANKLLGFRRRDWSGMSHEEIVSKQNEELDDLMRSPSIDPSFTGGGNDVRESAENVERYISATDWDCVEGVEIKLESFETKLKIHNFKLGGLGESGRGCGEIIASEINIGEEEDGIYGIRYHPVDCLRIQCPNCYTRWALERTFNIVIRIEAMALIRNERPFHVIYSVPPQDCTD